MKNKFLIKYVVKYFILLVIATYAFQGGAYLVNQKDDFAKLLGCAIFTGLAVGGAVVLASDINKVQTILKNKKENEQESN